jgi:CheY-like chemotaxis protein
MSRRSGTLQLTTPAQAGEIVFRLGKVVAGYVSDAQQTVGEGLIDAGVLDPAVYQDMLAAQREGKQGAALFQAFSLQGEALESALEEQLKRTIYTMFEWKEGTFSFVLEDQPDAWRGFAIDAGRAVTERGLNPQYLAIEGARIRDEHTKEDSLDSFIAMNAEPPNPAITASNSESLARSLRDEAKAGVSGGAGASGGAATAAKVLDEDWSQLQLETVAPILPPKARPKPPAADDADKVIPFPGGRRRDASRAEAAAAQAPAAQPAPVAAPAALAEAADVEPEPIIEASPEEAGGEQPASAIPDAAPAGAVSPWTLLVIDDDVQVVQHIRDAFRPRFTQVLTAGTVAEAHGVLSSAFPALVVVTDLIIARSDGQGILGGVEILESIRARSATVPVVMFSDYQNEEAEARARALGVTAQLMKPRKAQIYGDGRRAGVTPPMRDFLGRLEAALAPYLVPGSAAPAASGPAPAAPAVDAPIGHTEARPLWTPPRKAPGTDDGTYDLRGELEAALAEAPLPDVELPPAIASAGEMGNLRSMIAEMRDPSSRDAVTLLVLRFASALVERGALFLATRRAFVGLGGFSVAEGSDRFVVRVRQLQVPVEMDSVFSKVLRFRSMIREPLDETDGNRRLIMGLGDSWHSYEAVAAPLISGDRVAAILFGDNPSGKPLGVTDSLEIFLQQAGLVMERALLERKLEESRRRDPGKK